MLSEKLAFVNMLTDSEAVYALPAKTHMLSEWFCILSHPKEKEMH